MPASASRPALTAAAGVVVAEALVLVGLAVVELVELDSARLGLGVANAVFFAAYAAALGWCARGLVRLSLWSRGPIVLTQLIQLGVAWSFLGGATTAVAVALGVLAAVVLVLVLSPSTTSALYGDGGRPT